METAFPKFILARKEQGKRKRDKGEVLSVTNRPCHGGCRGLRLCVRWQDGSMTYPCSKGMNVIDDETWEIA